MKPAIAANLNSRGESVKESRARAELVASPLHETLPSCPSAGRPANLRAVQIPLAKCTLRTWRLEDAPALAANANNRNVWIKLRDRMPHPYTLADAEAYLHERAKEPERLMFCIDVDGGAAGGIGLHLGEDVNRFTAELGYWLGEPFWGRGIMTEAVPAIVQLGFERLPLHRIEAYVYDNNPASARVLEKAGFTLEGRLRRSVVKDGCVLDSFLFAKLREDTAPASTRSLGCG